MLKVKKNNKFSSHYAVFYDFFSNNVSFFGHYLVYFFLIDYFIFLASEPLQTCKIFYTTVKVQSYATFLFL